MRNPVTYHQCMGAPYTGVHKIRLSKSEDINKRTQSVTYLGLRSADSRTKDYR
jgi:hypothetical protein